MNIPDHQLLCRIGKGSYGEVWLARNVMGAFRSVKIVSRQSFENDLPYDRELAGIEKYEPISRRHDGLIDILQIGKSSDNSAFYYVMELADDLNRGQSIDFTAYTPRTLSKEHRLVGRFSVERTVKIGMTLCETLEFLHAKGLVHRDIKPANIVFINDSPKLADVGLVTGIDAKSIVGTEGFIPPEGPGTEQADIYSLGKVLYEISTGRDREEFPVLPSEFGSDGGRFLELNEVLLRACSKDTSTRYKAASEMYEDLALLASGKSLRRLRIAEKRLQKIQRGAAIAAGLLLLAGLLGFPFYQSRKYAAEMRERQIGSGLANAANLLNAGDYLGALGEFGRIEQLEVKPERIEINRLRWPAILASAPKLVQFVVLNSPVRRLEFGHDGKTLLVSSQGPAIRLIDVVTGANTIPPFGPEVLEQSSWGSENQIVLSSGRIGVSSWDSKTGSPAFEIPHSSRSLCVRLSPNGKLILTGAKDGIARMWDAQTHKLLFPLEEHSDGVKSVEFSPNSRICATTSYDGSACLWDTSNGARLSPRLRHSPDTWVVGAAFSPDSKVLVTAGHDGWAKRWKAPSGEEITSVMRHGSGVSAVAFSPDGRFIATASFDGTVKIWDAATSMPVEENHVLPHSGGVFTLDFNSGGELLATGCTDGTLRVWDLTSIGLRKESFSGTINSAGTIVAKIESSQLKISSFDGKMCLPEITAPSPFDQVALSEDGRVIAISTRPSSNSVSTLRLWKTASQEHIGDIVLQTNTLSRLKISLDSSFLVCLDGVRPRLFSCDNAREILLPPSLTNASEFAFSPQRKELAFGAANRVGILDLVNGSVRLFPEVLRANIKRLTYGGDGNTLIASLADNNITGEPAEVFDVGNGFSKRYSLWHADGVCDAAFRTDGKRIATAGEDQELNIWDVSTAEKVASLHHQSPVGAVSYSPNGKFLASLTADHTLHLWDAELGFPLSPPQKILAHRLTFLPNSRQIAVFEGGHDISIYTLTTNDISVADISRFNSLLSSKVSGSTGPAKIQLKQLWRDLQKRFPEHFGSSQASWTEWHKRQADSAEAEALWSVAAFHWEKASTLEPQNSLSRQRLEAAQMKVALPRKN